MYRSIPCSSPWLDLLRRRLQEAGYCHRVAKQYDFAARCFLLDLERRGQPIESVSPSNVDMYLANLKRLRDRQPLPVVNRRKDCASIKMLLRLVHNGKWPPEFAQATDHDIVVCDLVRKYDTWMVEMRGLSQNTRRNRRFEMYSLLRWLHDHGKSIETLCLADLDAYIASRVVVMKRRSKAEVISTLRGVLRYLFDSNQTPTDLADAVEGPIIYQHETTPTTIPRSDIDRVLEIARCDRSPLGIRNYAILMLLSTYGLRSGEIRGLRLSDIDWRHERIHIRHTKTGACSELPLLRGPADALFDYLECGRPATSTREVFVQAVAPYGPLRAGLHRVLNHATEAAGVSLTGKRGVHVLRHSRAESLLGSGVSIKVIGDILGHYSVRATTMYLKLATDDLRSVALDLPQEVTT
ncbi:Tyrosine recombinase XerC [Paraburkholderia aspalathi]|uniref:site-specific integrase n=2 Tax=Paraburkholderia aspalathi TaxID=1324617 RepID=UPI00190D9785|nr:site-specific integrase [Paraburkholderia aspalathi]MBK3841953.1 tyrosine-type recombinase/integrase [Paraburkholderia aspalathi]CAE6817628.1 Tyrosine recombinase XerC [Paraburkholderia aspalathi]CAE6873251.1 Tyrosine recombinase XerC [Paraburkholderia aspalathi]